MSDIEIQNFGPESDNNEKADEPRLGYILELVALLVATPVGLYLGGLTGFLPAGPILGMVVPIALGTYLLQRRGQGWTDLGLKRPRSIPRALAWGLLAIVGGSVAGQAAAWLATEFGGAAPDISILVDFIEGDLVNYLWFLIPISWMSAGIGEEMIVRGFFLDRFNRLFGMTTSGTALAVIAQAVLFGLAHSYQGLTGVLSVTALALVFGFVFLRAGRNLWATIFAHATIDTIGITAIYLGYAGALGG